MKNIYDKHYQTENLFGNPYPVLIEYFSTHHKNCKVLDLGCGQGRDSVAIARLGHSVTGIDTSKVGIDQMNQIAKKENLDLKGIVSDIYEFGEFYEFDIILLDSMFHFSKNEREKEIGLLEKIFAKINNGTSVVVCIQDTGNKVQTLNQVIYSNKQLNRKVDRLFKYTFEDKDSGHKSETNYRMIVVEKE